jgi:hypothetical protein
MMTLSLIPGINTKCAALAEAVTKKKMTTALMAAMALTETALMVMALMIRLPLNNATSAVME